MDPDETLHNRVTYIAQSVTCLATEACLTADPGITSSILVRSHTFMEVGHEIISVVILTGPDPEEGGALGHVPPPPPPPVRPLVTLLLCKTI